MLENKVVNNIQYEKDFYANEDLTHKYIDDLGAHFCFIRYYNEKSKRHAGTIRIKIVDSNNQIYYRNIRKDEYAKLKKQMQSKPGKRGRLEKILNLGKKNNIQYDKVEFVSEKKLGINERKSEKGEDYFGKLERLERELNNSRKDLVENENKINSIYKKISNVLGFLGGKSRKSPDRENYLKKYTEKLSALRKFKENILRKRYSREMERATLTDWNKKEEKLKKEIGDAMQEFDWQEQLQLYETRTGVMIESAGTASFREGLQKRSASLIENYQKFNWKKQVSLAVAFLGAGVIFFHSADFLNKYGADVESENTIYYNVPKIPDASASLASVGLSTKQEIATTKKETKKDLASESKKSEAVQVNNYKLKISKGDSIEGVIIEKLKENNFSDEDANRVAHLTAIEYAKLKKISLNKLAKKIQPNNVVEIEINKTDLEKSKIVNIDNELLNDRNEVLKIVDLFCTGDEHIAEKIMQLKELEGDKFLETYREVIARIARELFVGTETPRADLVKNIDARAYLDSGCAGNLKVKELRNYNESFFGKEVVLAKPEENLKQWTERMICMMLKTTDAKTDLR